MASSIILLGALAAAGCGGGGEVKTALPTRSLDERRAIEVIRKAMKAEGAEPANGREVKLATGDKEIHVDVGVLDHEYGIVYVTPEDAEKLGAAIPAANKRDERLRLIRAGEGGETRLVLLYQENYLYDDLGGEDHENTTITAERALARDVQDFVTYARTQKFK